MEYLVQLPPEYDPLRRYPAIVALRPLGAPTTAMVDFWAGAPVATEGSPGGARAGQAMRRGYVVLAIDWPAEDQLRYEHSSGEHGAVLAAIRDAMRRVSIDSDSVFLTGHGEGGDAAWDIALAHPDHWAGVLPFLARADRYVVWYTENAEHLPWRLVFGELDAGKVAHNGPELDRYLRPGRDAVVVEYRGRGYDPLGDELQRAMEWMARRKRAAPPDSFECKSFRPWDNYFWWLEAGGFAERAIVAPAAWPPKRGVRPTPLQGRRLSSNKLRVNARVDRVTVWLAPDLVDFSQPIEVEWNGRRLTNRGALIEPDLAVLLEDARTRGDRSRPYWAKVSSF